MKNTSDESLKAPLEGANFANLATLRQDGSPQVDSVWIGREAERILGPQTAEKPPSTTSSEPVM